MSCRTCRVFQRYEFSDSAEAEPGAVTGGLKCFSGQIDQTHRHPDDEYRESAVGKAHEDHDQLAPFEAAWPSAAPGDDVEDGCKEEKRHNDCANERDGVHAREEDENAADTNAGNHAKPEVKAAPERDLTLLRVFHDIIVDDFGDDKSAFWTADSASITNDVAALFTRSVIVGKAGAWRGFGCRCIRCWSDVRGFLRQRSLSLNADGSTPAFDRAGPHCRGLWLICSRIWTAMHHGGRDFDAGRHTVDDDASGTLCEHLDELIFGEGKLARGGVSPEDACRKGSGD